MIEELEGIHTTKVDRFEIDDILADKADCSEVQCKVSTDIFEEFCNSLTKGVDYAIKNTVEQVRLICLLSVNHIFYVNVLILQ